MHYEINVALNGHHLFATSKRSLPNEDRFKKCLEIIRAKFPESEGYKITCTRWEEVGYRVEG